ncbi:carboxylesterase family protein [Nonomuraea africana]|uniref:carboxylesterase family protein n=2 Tax=Nonomuraea africana TaxID=46171 RepID=UPI0033C38FDB
MPYGMCGSRPPQPPMMPGMPEWNPADGLDCLTVNVWTPDPGGSGLPVMVWIYGGALPPPVRRTDAAW